MRPFIVVSAAALVLLTACSGGGNGASSGAGGHAAVARAPSKEADGASRAQNVRLAPAQAIIYTADLTMRSGDVTGAAGRAKSAVTAAGGYVGNESATENPGSRPSATITFKIPSARYQGVLDQLASSRIGTRVSLRQQADDATQEVADVDSRVKSAKATLASFRKLLGKASDIDDIVRLEQEIAGRESDLEALQARQRSLAAQTGYATVTLRLEGTTPTRRDHHRSTGFSGGVSSGWHAFTVFVKGLAIVVGWLLPFLGLAALIGLPARWLWRRRRSSRSSAA
ncbi:DUF4349 domain-containing protein [Actinoallomurus acaciae]|uniref:DUF4349 domain-containing protein n=1 Tax=Actinoallomurus acaciae TaxID=502577 RepID=A0ABV5YV70_9ACTN